MPMLFWLFFVLTFFLSCQPVPEGVPLEKYKRQFVHGRVFIKEDIKHKITKEHRFLVLLVSKPDNPNPLAVLKVKNPQFPYDFKIHGKHKVEHERLMEGVVLITAKLGKSDSLQEEKGDLIGSITAHVGSRGVNLIIDKQVE